MREKTLKFSSTVLPAPSPYPQRDDLLLNINDFMSTSFLNAFQFNYDIKATTWDSRSDGIIEKMSHLTWRGHSERQATLRGLLEQTHMQQNWPLHRRPLKHALHTIEVFTRTESIIYTHWIKAQQIFATHCHKVHNNYVLLPLFLIVWQKMILSNTAMLSYLNCSTQLVVIYYYYYYHYFMAIIEDNLR